jgi:hypothetical protein
LGGDVTRNALLPDFATRLSDKTKDARIYNGLAEGGDLIKRPGMLPSNLSYQGMQGWGAAFDGALMLVYQDIIIIDSTLWVRSRQYTYGDVVIYLGGYYIATGSISGEPPYLGSPYWTPVADYVDGDTYNDGDVVVSYGDSGDNETGALVVWYAVGTSTGVKPGHSSLAQYNRWSRYPAKPSGTHPSLTYTETSYQSPPNPQFNDAYTIFRTMKWSGAGYSMQYSGSVYHTPGPHQTGDISNVYNAMPLGQVLYGGYDLYPSSSFETQDISPSYAASDFIRSHII